MKHFTFDNRWDAIKGQLKQRYAQLTDDDLTFAEGKGDELLARLRDKVGASANEFSETMEDLYGQAGSAFTQAKAKVGEWTGDLRGKADALTDDLKEKAGAAAEEVKAKATAAYDHARDRAVKLGDEGAEYVRHNPRKSLLIALGAGFVAGLVIKR